MANKNTSGITNIIGEGTEIEGKMIIPGSIRIDGTVNGEMQVSEQLTVGRKGRVKGEMLTRDAVIAGRVEGKIVVKNKIELQKNAKVDVDLNCKLLVIEEGVIFDGTCSMSNPKAEISKDMGKEQPANK
ncbi:MAG: polymer-forming cytoskeletal protein [candidate division WOR-3 bacterium]|nr:polymer-forming cytoskeletal protein [candidate division WOR-3 bacterium]